MEDIISDICFENLPCEGVVLAEETYKDLEMISTTEGTLRVFLNPQDCNSAAVSESHVKKVLSEQRKLLKSRGFSDEELGSWEFVYSEKENEDWSKKWKEKWDVTHVSDRITVVPDWIEYTPEHEDEVIIKLEPGCAFGTGTHATTQLCMKAIEKYMPENADIADIGMGSGILAICAKKFGANYAYGCDNDETVIDVAKETVIDVAKENAIKNGVRLSPTNSQGGYSNELKDPSSKSKIHYLSQNDTQSFCSAGSQGEDSSTPPLEGGVEAKLPGWGYAQAEHNYNQNNKVLAKELRNNSTEPERILWTYLKNSQLKNTKFRRQQPIGNYIVDFFAPQKKLIIELDGGQHNSNVNILMDKERDKYLVNAGYQVVRIWNNEIYHNIEGVIAFISDILDNHPTSKSKIHYLSQNDTQSFCSAGSQGEDNTTPPPEGGVEAQLPGWGHSQATQLETGCFFELNTADKIDRQFDFVLANILHNVLAEIMGDLKAIMKDDAYMVLSGILDEKKPVVLDAIKKHNLELIEEMHQNQWVALVVRK